MSGRLVLCGIPASPGCRRGRARVIHTVAELAGVRPGEILVAPYAAPDLVIAFDRIGGLVTDQGGRLAHAAVVARELRVPAVVGTQSATASVPDGSTIELNGSTGTVVVLGLDHRTPSA